jgi:CO/xanthine dehydrogenase Mo-binding subunit/aerobic-type carbon monoxide dehydrogenase small subunit (CoxS/CutS family)
MTNEPSTKQIHVVFNLNGNNVSATVPETKTLLRFLRDDLRLTGAKNGCSTGHCGACTVIMNGKAQRSCLVKMARVNNAEIETIEHLEQNGRLHPIQRAFIESGAVQCGFCSPGMIMSAKALLTANPDPSARDIQEHLTKNKNYCRCTGYVKIIEAIQLSARWMADAKLIPEETKGAEKIDRSVRYKTAREFVTGGLKFGDDMLLENMVYGRILWATFPHAKILSIDTSEAEAFPGVAGVVTAKDIPGKNQCGIVIRDQPAIASDVVRYIGDSVAAVFAETSEIAEAALSKIKVEYKELPGVFSPEEAAKPDAPKLHEKGNLLHQVAIVRGDVDEAFKNCAVIVEDNYSTPAIEHAFIEPESGLGFPTEDGGVEIRIGSQTVFDDRIQLSEILALPEEKIRVIQNPIGGAFGAKEDMILQQYLALGALKTKRPVKMVLSREESLMVHVKRHPAKLHYKTGADSSGHVLALEVDIVLDTGIYCSLGLDILENTVVFSAGPYYIPNLRVNGKSWYTNNVPSGAMRGFGVNQIAVALEQNMDAMAEKLGINPFEFRLINGLDIGLPTASDHILTPGVVSIKETIHAAWDAFKKVEIPKPTPGKKIGVGVAAAVKNIGFGHGIPESAGAIVELNSDGDLLIRHSQHEYGQGANVGLIKLAMNELEVPAEKIEVIGPDTGQTPPTGPTTASRQTYLTGKALVMACQSLKEEVTSRAAEHLGVPPAQLKIQGNKVVNPETDESIDIKELGKKFTVEKTYVPQNTVQMHPVGEPSEYGSARFKTMVTHYCYAYNTQVAIVEVDENTGEVKVLKIISANDVGKVLNYDAVIGQIQGGVMMGLGFALSEHFLVEKGINLTNTLGKCRIPSADMTPEIIPVVVEVPHPDGPEGVKGFAEAPSLATAPAILNAIYHATGVRVRDLPADPQKVLAALKNKKA